MACYRDSFALTSTLRKIEIRGKKERKREGKRVKLNEEGNENFLPVEPRGNK
jgi:hypothetical protein